jgi:hypothetical protein
MKKKEFDCEPKWIDVIKIWKAYGLVKNEYVMNELKRMAKICDVIRQATKQGKTLIIKDGEITEQEVKNERRNK